MKNTISAFVVVFSALFSVTVGAAFWLALATAFYLASPLSSARAAITPTGDVRPSNPSKWYSSTEGYVGYATSGNLTVDGGSSLLSDRCYIGYQTGSTGIMNIDGTGSTWTNKYDLYVGFNGSGSLTITGGGAVSDYSGYIGSNPGSTGVATVDGTGSTWNNRGNLYVGKSGSGALAITNGGTVTVNGTTYAAYGETNTGTIDFGTSNGGTLTTLGLYVAASNLKGSGTINTNGLVSDLNLTFNSSANCSATFGTGGNVTVNMSSANNVAELGVGYASTAALVIENGASIYSGAGYLGYNAASSGMATVDGTGSTWNTSGNLYVGNGGSGSLAITNGGTVTNSSSSSFIYIGNSSGSTGVVTVNGAGSTLKLIKSCNLYVGNYGSGTLSIMNGGNVSGAGTTYVGACAGSTGSINFGPNSGTLTTRSLYASPAQLGGTGTINTQGLVSDIDLQFDSTHGLKQMILFQQAGQNVTLNLDMSSSTEYGDLGAGWKGTGSLVIRDGVHVKSFFGYLGYGSDSTGVATVDGTGSTWYNSSKFLIGNGGNGTLSITRGGSVTGAGTTFVGSSSGAKGAITVDGIGSYLQVNSDFIFGIYGSGTLSITHSGSVMCYGRTCIGGGPGSTGLVTVDGTGSTMTSPNGMVIGDYGNGTLSITNGGSSTNGGSVNGQFEIGVNAGSTGKVIVNGSRSTLISSNYLIVGESGSGTVSITAGGSVSSKYGTIGQVDSGLVTVDGTGSTWKNSSYLTIGDSGSGTLSITNGGSVSSVSATLCAFQYSTGFVMVDGTGSTWNNSTNLNLGRSGLVSITGGGSVTSAKVSISNLSMFAIDVGRGSVLTVGGSGTLTNYGTIRILAGAGVAADGTIYSPISAGTWSGSGAYQPVGGTWNSSNHTFTVSSVTSGAAGSPVLLNLATVQRALIDDTESGGQIGASFVAATSTQNITFTATAMSGTTLDTLQSLLPTNESILSGWTFATTNYNVTSTNPVYLSFNVGAGYPANNLDLWHYDGSTWTPYKPTDLTYDGTFASFTATSFSGYAVACVNVPEPGTIALLATALLGALGYAWRKREVCV